MGLGEQDNIQEEKKRYEIKTEQVHQGPVHQEGGPQTQANLQTNATQLVDTQIEENMQLVAQAQSTLEQTHATETAQGGPVLEQIPQNEKFFQRRKRRKLQTKLAKRLSGNATADYVGYNLQRGIQKKKEMIENSRNKLGIPANADQYLSKFFLKGCQLNKDGQPASPQDMQNFLDDQKVWEAFSSGDVMARKPYLDNMVSDVLKVDLTMDKLTPEYLEQHGMEVLRQCELISEAEKVLLQDKGNWQYVKTLSDDTFMQLRSILKLNHQGSLQKLVHESFRKHGVNVDSEKLWEAKPWSKEDERQYQELQKTYKSNRVDPKLNIPAHLLTDRELAKRRKAQKQLAQNEAGFTMLLDHNSYIYNQNKDEWNRKVGNTLEEYDKKAKKIKGAKLSDSENIRLWVTLLRVVGRTEDGKPATALDEAALKYNETMVEDFLSGDFERQKPYVDHYLNELLNLEITSDMFTDEYMEEHALEVWRKMELLGCYELMITKNPVRLAYFESLPESVKNRVKKVEDFYNGVSNVMEGPIVFAFSEYLAKKGLKPLGDYNSDYKEEENLEDLAKELQDQVNSLEKRKKRMDHASTQEGGIIREIREHRMTVEEEIKKSEKSPEGSK